MKPKSDNKIILYQDDNGITNVNVLFSDEDLWLTQNQIAEIYDTTQPNISMHIDSILRDGELPDEATHKKVLLVLESDFDHARDCLTRKGKRHGQRRKFF